MNLFGIEASEPIASVADRVAFWQQAHERLAKLAAQ
jgi:hypothetical protein